MLIFVALTSAYFEINEEVENEQKPEYRILYQEDVHSCNFVNEETEPNDRLRIKIDGTDKFVCISVKNSFRSAAQNKKLGLMKAITPITIMILICCLFLAYDKYINKEEKS